MMSTSEIDLEKKIDKALLESLSHWKDNVEKFNNNWSLAAKTEFWRNSCSGSSCPLCDLSDEIYDFDKGVKMCIDERCPLINSNHSLGQCCIEWQEGFRAIYSSECNENVKHYLVAIYEKIESECKKRELL